MYYEVIIIARLIKLFINYHLGVLEEWFPVP